MSKEIDVKNIKEELENVANDLGMKPKGKDGLEAVEYVVLQALKIPKDAIHISWRNNEVINPNYRWEACVKVNDYGGINNENSKFIN